MEGIKVVIYGEPKTGKTTWLKTLLEDDRLYPVLLADCEGGVKSIRSVIQEIELDELGKKKSKFDVVRVRSIQDLQTVYDFLFKDRYEEERAYYKTIVLDSISEINDAVLSQICNNNLIGLKAKPIIPKFGEYADLNIRIDKFLTALRDIEDLNVIVTALPNPEYEQEGTNQRLVAVKPYLTGKLKDKLTAKFDAVLYMKANSKGERLFITAREGPIVAGLRVENSKFERNMPVASMPAKVVYDAIQGN